MSIESTIEIVVSTMNDRVYKVVNDFQRYLTEGVIVTIIHQITDGRTYNINPVGFRYFRYYERGLPISRNRGLDNAIGDIVIPTDDDVSFEKNFQRVILNAFELAPQADVITFMAKTPSGGLYKNYQQKPFNHTWRTLLQVSSIEICLKRSSFIESDARWDLDFGLGAKFAGGLEVVFLQDCRRKKLSMIYYPNVIVCHPEESSGKRFNSESVRLRGAVLSRAFGVLGGVLLSLAFYLKKRQLLSSERVGFLTFIKQSFFGVVDYIKWSRR